MFAPLIADIEAVNDRFDDDQLAAILDYLSACNDAVERSTARLRERLAPSECLGGIRVFAVGATRSEHSDAPNTRMGRTWSPRGSAGS